MIFVVGYSRSGTTMMGRILGQHPKVHTFGELHFFEHLAEGAEIVARPPLAVDTAKALVERLLTSSRRDFFAAVTPSTYSTEVDGIIAGCSQHDAVSLYQAVLAHETARANAEIPCEQTPRYLYFLDEILQAMPEARVVFLVRDPRDVLISQANKWRRRSLGARNIPRREALRAWINYHPILIARLWAGASFLGRSYAIDPRVITVRFEDLVSEPERVVRAVAAHVGLDYRDDMLNVPHVGSSCSVDAPERMGINPSIAGGWRSGGLGASGTKLCEWVAGDEMRVRGYELTGSGQAPWALMPSIALLVFKLLISLPLNLSRTKNLRETLLRRFGKSS